MAKRKAKSSKRQRASTGAKLRNTFENNILSRMVKRLDNEEAGADELAKLMHAYCELRKQDIAGGKAGAIGASPPSDIGAGDAPQATGDLRRLVNAVYGVSVGAGGQEIGL